MGVGMRCADARPSLVSPTVGNDASQDPGDWEAPGLARVLDLVRDAVVVLDVDNVIRYLNPPAAERLGGAPAALVGESILELLPGFAGTLLADELDRIHREGGTSEVDQFIRALDGRFRVDFSAVDDCVVVLVREITETRRGERSRRITERVDAGVAGTSTLAAALEATVTALREELDFDVGEVWLTDRRVGIAELLVLDHGGVREEFAAFLDATRDLCVDNVGVLTEAGRAMLESGAVVVTEVDADPVFKRREAARASGLRVAAHFGLDLGIGRSAAIGLVRTRPLDDDDSIIVLDRLRGHVEAVLSRHAVRLELEQFFEFSREYITVSGIDGILDRVNPSFARALGYEIDELEGRQIVDLVHPEDVELTTGVFADMMRRRLPIERLENRVRRSNGRTSWISWTSHAIVEQGVVYSTGRDVTVERAQRLLRDGQNAFLRAVLSDEPLEVQMGQLVSVVELIDDRAIASVVGHDESTGVLTVLAAPSLPEWYRASLDGVPVGTDRGSCGMAILERREVIAEDIATDPRFEKHRDDAARAGFVSCWSVPIVGSNDEAFGALSVHGRNRRQPSERHLTMLRNLVQLAGIAFQRHRAATQLTASEERFRKLAEIATDAIFDWDIVSGSRWRSDSFSVVFGEAPGDDEASRDWWLEAIHPDDRERVVDGRDRALAGDGELWVSEQRMRRADGTFGDVVIRGVIMRDEAGSATRMIGGITDLTERRTLERQFLRAQRVESLGTLAGGIAHDLNNSLAPILMAVDLLQGADLGDDNVEVVDTIAKSARRSAEMVRKMLTYARGVEGEHAAVPVLDLVGEAIHLVKDSIPKEVEVVLESTASDPSVGGLTVVGDATQLHQVLVNLILNARDAMPDGGRLSIEVEEVDIGSDRELLTATSELKPGRYVAIAVADTGTGIVPAVVARLFEPFFTTKARSDGTGLGLPTSLAIARGHAGDLAVETEVGRGSIFTLVLPVAPTSTSGASGPSPDPIPGPGLGSSSWLDDDLDGGGVTVLVVDDEPSIRAVVRDTLEGSGYRVLEASDGRLAFDVFRAQEDHIGIVLTDIMMAHMDGAELAAQLRTAGSRVPIVAMTGLDDSVRSTALAESGVTIVIPKPFDRTTLLSALSAVRPDPD